MSRTEEVSREDLLEEIGRLRSLVADLTQRAERAEALAVHDVLTPALNRRGFVAAVSRGMSYCRRHGIEAALLYLDMDGFKAINDTYGHAAGDAALVTVADFLKGHVRESDSVGRLGGDEFAILLLNADHASALEKAARLSEGLAGLSFDWQGRSITLGGSVGASALSTQIDAETWLSEADSAMWRVKLSRKSAR